MQVDAEERPLVIADGALLQQVEGDRRRTLRRARVARQVAEDELRDGRERRRLELARQRHPPGSETPELVRVAEPESRARENRAVEAVRVSPGKDDPLRAVESPHDVFGRLERGIPVGALVQRLGRRRLPCLRRYELERDRVRVVADLGEPGVGRQAARVQLERDVGVRALEREVLVHLSLVHDGVEAVRPDRRRRQSQGEIPHRLGRRVEHDVSPVFRQRIGVVRRIAARPVSARVLVPAHVAVVDCGARPRIGVRRVRGAQRTGGEGGRPAGRSGRDFPRPGFHLTQTDVRECVAHSLLLRL